MRSKIIFPFAAMLFAVLALRAADDPLVGTWKLNLAKSKFDPGPPPKSIIVKYESIGADSVKRTQDVVRANGEKIHDVIEYTFDGKVYPFPNSTLFDAMMSRHLDAYTTERIFMKGGKTVNTVRRVVSKDSKTLSITDKGLNTQGRLHDTFEVYDKQ